MKPFNQSDEHFLALLRRWVSGEINRREEAELGRLAAEDDFRREALEGFQTVPEADHAARLSALEARLRKRAPGGRAMPLWPRYMAAAAVFALLVTAVWFLPHLNENAPAVAEQKNAEPRDSGQMAPAPSAQPADSEPIAQLKSPANSAVSPSAKMKAPTAGSAEPLKSEDDLAYMEEKLKEEDLAAAKPAPEVAVEQATRPADKDMGKKKAQDAKPAVWDGGPAGNMATQPARSESPVAAIQPIGGWDDFQDFLNNNARLTPAARNNNVTGFVRLEFSLDSSGMPTAIRVLHTLGYGCDEEAIRLLRQRMFTGPTGKATQVDVWFRR